MLRTIIETSLRYRFLVMACAGALLVVGGLRGRSMPADTFPEFAPPVVEVQTEAPGLAASEVERLVTLPVEELLSGVSWLKTLRSESVAGLSSVRLIFERGTDLMRARQLVQERLTLSYTIPTVAKAPVMLQPLSSTSRVMMIGLSSSTLPLIQQSVLAQWTIKPKLLGVPGVANVAIWGERKRQLQVQVDSSKLREAGVKHEQVVSSAGDSLYVASLSFLKASNPGSGGWIDGPNQRLEIRHILPMSSAEELGRVSVDGTNKRLADIASVVEGHPPMVGDALVDGKTGLILVVEKFPGANTVDVTRRVDAALASLRAGMPGLTIDHQLFRAANFVEEALENNGTAMLTGLGLLVLALILMLYNVRAAIVALISISLAVGTVLLIVNLVGATLNTVVLAGIGLALAAIVDEIVTVVESVLRKARSAPAGTDRPQLMTIVAEAAARSRRTIGYTTLGMLLLALPIFFMGGLGGAFLTPLAATYMLAIAVAVVTALTVTPVLSFLLLTGRSSQSEPAFVQRLRGRYQKVLSAVLQRPTGAYAAITVVALGAIAMWPLLNRSLLPEFQDRDLVVRWDAPPGTSHPGMMRITTNVVQELKAIPGVRSVGAHFGRAITGDQVVSMNSGQIWISIDQAADYDKTLLAIRSTIADYPGIQHDVQSYLRERIREALTGTATPVVVRIYGPDREVLGTKAEEVRQLLARVNGLVDLRVEGQVTEPQVQVKVDLAAAANSGLKPGDVRRAAAALFAGLEVGKIFEQQKVFDVVVWSPDDIRASVTGLTNMLVETPSSGQVRLGELSDIRVVSTPTVIRHERSSPYIDVTANVAGRDIGAAVSDVERRLADVRFPLEHHPEILGEFAERRMAQTRMLAVVVGSAVGIFLLLQALLGSWSMSAVTVAALLASLSGGVISALAFGGEVSIGSMVAFLGVLAMAFRQAVMLIQRLQDSSNQGQSIGADLVLDAASDRVVPIMATALAVAALLLPMIVPGNISGFEIGRPMAIVMLGGLIASTLIVLFVIPTLYLKYANSMSNGAIKGEFS